MYSPNTREIFQTWAHLKTQHIFKCIVQLEPQWPPELPRWCCSSSVLLKHVGWSLVSNRVSHINRYCTIYLKAWCASIFTTYWPLPSQLEYVSPRYKFQSRLLRRQELLQAIHLSFAWNIAVIKCNGQINCLWSAICQRALVQYLHMADHTQRLLIKISNALGSLLCSSFQPHVSQSAIRKWSF